MVSRSTRPWISSVKNNGPRPSTRSSPGPSRGPPQICHLPLTSTTPLLFIRLHLFHTLQAHRHPGARDIETRRGGIVTRRFFPKPDTPYFSAAKRLFAAKNRFGLLSPLTFHQASSDLDEQRGRSGIVWGYERSFDVLGASRKVRWQHKVYKLIVASLDSSHSQYKVYKLTVSSSDIPCSRYKVYKPNVSPLDILHSQYRVYKLIVTSLDNPHSQYKVYNLIVSSSDIPCSQYKVYKPNVSPLDIPHSQYRVYKLIVSLLDIPRSRYKAYKPNASPLDIPRSKYKVYKLIISPLDIPRSQYKVYKLIVSSLCTLYS